MSASGNRLTALKVAVDLVAPIALYYGLRSAGAGVFLALLVGSAPPALSVTVRLIRDRRVDGLAAVVLIMLLLSTGVALIGGGPRFLLAKDGWLTAAWGLLFLASLRAKRPLSFLFGRALLDGRTVYDPRTRQWSPPAGESWDDLWERLPRFRRVWRVSTIVWGTGMLVDAAIRVLMAYTLPPDLVPGLGGALWPLTIIVLQVTTNVYFFRSGMLLMLLGEPDLSHGERPASATQRRRSRAEYREAPR